MAKKFMLATPEELKHHIEVVQSLDGFVETLLPRFPVAEKSWQPTDFLPDLTRESDELTEYRKSSAHIHGPVLDILILDMITEEALPTYMSLLNRVGGIKDLTGVDQTAFAKLIRAWTAEENRHGELLNTYLLLNPHVNHRAVSESVQRLIRNGFDNGDGRDPYKTFIYTSFQEKATYVSHSNVAKLAKAAGDNNLFLLCMKIAGDEQKHGNLYVDIMKKVFDTDPDGAMVSFAYMMQENIKMPGQFMGDGSDSSLLFKDMSDVAQKIGVYTTQDYISIMRMLISDWKIKDRHVTSEDTKQAQEYLLNLPGRMEKLLERKKSPHTPELATKPSPWRYSP